jgi:hypothetical protein
MIKIIRKNLKKDANPYYVVTREGRRVEDKNYQTQSDAELRAAKLIAMVRECSPHERDSVSIVYTSEPYKIR